MCWADPPPVSSKKKYPFVAQVGWDPAAPWLSRPDAPGIGQKELKEALEKGNTDSKVEHMKQMIMLHMNGEPQTSMLMTFIRFVLPDQAPQPHGTDCGGLQSSYLEILAVRCLRVVRRHRGKSIHAAAGCGNHGLGLRPLISASPNEFVLWQPSVEAVDAAANPLGLCHSDLPSPPRGGVQ